MDMGGRDESLTDLVIPGEGISRVFPLRQWQPGIGAHLVGRQVNCLVVTVAPKKGRQCWAHYGRQGLPIVRFTRGIPMRVDLVRGNRAGLLRTRWPSGQLGGL